MKKSFIYILGFAAAVMFSSCEKDSLFNTRGEGLKTNTSTETPKDTSNWAVCDVKDLIVGEDMIVHSLIGWLCTNGTRDTSYMEPWLLDIYAKDMTIYRDTYQPTKQSGKTPNAERTTGEETKDAYGNLVKRHSYSQPYEFNNFTHSISGAWTTGRVLYGNGKEESYWPENGLYYEISSISGNTVADTTHFVRNDSIFAKEVVHITYKATLKVSSKSYTWRSWERTATITVISFVGIVIPSAEEYVPNLKGHVSLGNRFFKKIGKDKDGDVGYWEDGFLGWSDDDYFMLIVHYTVDAKDGKSDERYVGKEIITLAKSEMDTPTSADREYNAVMWDYQRQKYIPCHLSEDYSFRYGSRYANGDPATYFADINGALMDGVKNFTKDKTATPTPWLETRCAETQYNGKNYYTVTLRSSVHTNVTTIADAALK